MADDALTQKLQPLLARLERLLAELDRIEEPDPGQRSKPYPPAPEAEIASREKQLDFEFPPSYRAFLRLHNGWRNFRFDWCIFGVSGPGYTKAAKELKSDLKMFRESYADEGPNYADKLKKKQKKDPKVIYLPDHPPLALDFNGDYMVFDRNRPGANGEYEIASVSNGEFVDCRYRDFLYFVQDTLRVIRSELKKHGVDPNEVEQSAEKDAKGK